MTYKPFIYAYNPSSGGARELAQALGARRIKHNQSKFRPSQRKVLINWGCSDVPAAYVNGCHKVLNPSYRVVDNTNKLLFFRHMAFSVEGPPRSPWWTTSKEEAAAAQEEGRPIVARTILTGHSGQGLVYCGVEGELPDAPLYVEYIKKKDEYRVHCIKGMEEQFVQRKVRVHSVSNPNWRVRNLSGGFRYANDPSNVGPVPSDVLVQAKLAFAASGLDFGAVDVIWNEQREEAYVLEINTAPGLMGRTVGFYAKGLTALIEE